MVNGRGTSVKVVVVVVVAVAVVVVVITEVLVVVVVTGKKRQALTAVASPNITVIRLCSLRSYTHNNEVFTRGAGPCKSQTTQ
jgi:hypothetical protein